MTHLLQFLNVAGDHGAIQIIQDANFHMRTCQMEKNFVKVVTCFGTKRHANKVLVVTGIHGSTERHLSTDKVAAGARLEHRLAMIYMWKSVQRNAMISQHGGMIPTVLNTRVTGTGKTAADAHGTAITTETSDKPQTKRAVVAGTQMAEGCLER